MRNYLEMWKTAIVGIAYLILAIIYPVIWLLLQLLPYGCTCLFTGMRLKKGYRYFYFLPRFIKEITKPLRKETECS